MMIVKIEIVQISLVLNAKTWNVWILLFWKILAYCWNSIRYWAKINLTNVKKIAVAGDNCQLIAHIMLSVEITEKIFPTVITGFEWFLYGF